MCVCVCGVINYDYGYVNKFKTLNLEKGVIKGLKISNKEEFLYFYYY